jgi:small-conductance mechanosensitive channel
LVILAERPITIGDRVEVAGVVGTVQQIRARSTVIITSDNIAMIVPNSKFIDSPVTNWHYGDTRVRFRLPVGVAYGSDVHKVREVLIDAASAHSATLTDPPPTAYLEKFGESTIDFELVAWTREMSARPRRFKSALNYLIYEHLTAAGIQIPKPQRELYIRDSVIKVESVETSRTA